MNEQLKEILSQSINARFEVERKLIEQAWQDEAFKQELLNNPKAALEKQIGQQLPEDTKIQILEESANTTYFVLPRNPAPIGAEGELTEEALEAVAGGVWASLTRRDWLSIRRSSAGDLL